MASRCPFRFSPGQYFVCFLWLSFFIRGKNHAYIVFFFFLFWRKRTDSANCTNKKVANNWDGEQIYNSSTPKETIRTNIMLQVTYHLIRSDLFQSGNVGLVGANVESEVVLQESSKTFDNSQMKQLDSNLLNHRSFDQLFSLDWFSDCWLFTVDFGERDYFISFFLFFFLCFYFFNF